MIIGAKITACFRRTFRRSNEHRNKASEQEPLLGQHKRLGDEIVPNGRESMAAVAPPRVRDVLNFQVTLNMLVYFMLAFYSLAYDQVRGASSLCSVCADTQVASPSVHAPPPSSHRPSRCLSSLQICRRLWYRCWPYRRHLHCPRSGINALTIPSVPASCALPRRSPVPADILHGLPVRLLCHAFHLSAS